MSDKKDAGKPRQARYERQMAVALGYAPPRDAAPRVIAKGAGLVAQRILDIARERGIAVREDRDLIRVLKEIDPGSYIPDELYAAVAEILAFIYRANKGFKKG
jgi:flagellar biosynthesis protein